METPGVNLFLQELESHCFSRAIATFLAGDGEPMVINLIRQGQQVTYGEDWSIKELFVAKLLVSCRPSGSLILRSFTLEIDQFTKLPIKELRGYILKGDGNDLEFEKLSPHAMFACHNTDAETDEPLPLEQSVRYC
ncbi:MAG TPA: hypothetical protein V6D14_16925 [Coleofasciculaceae cyanobacterium]|jgi:hypothetical protein